VITPNDIKNIDFDSIRGRMENLSHLLAIEMREIKLHAPPLVDDFDPFRRFTWRGWLEQLWCAGGVFWHIQDSVEGVDVSLLRNFAHIITRALLPYGEYEAEAERAYSAARPERLSSADLLSDLVLLYAMQTISDAIHRSENPEEIDGVTPSAQEIMDSIVGADKMQHVLADIAKEREDAVNRRVRILEYEQKYG